MRAVARAVGIGRVEHGAQQHLAPDAGSPALTRTQRQSRGEVAPGAVPGDAEKVGVDQTARALGGEAQGAVEVVETGREGMLGREAVVDAQHLGSGRESESPAQGVVVVEVAGDPSAAVGEDERSAVAGTRAVEAQGETVGVEVDRLERRVVGRTHPRRVRAQLGDPRRVIAVGIRRPRRDRARLSRQAFEVGAHGGVGDGGVDAHGSPAGRGSRAPQAALPRA